MSTPNDDATKTNAEGSQSVTPDVKATEQSSGINVNELAKKVEDMEKRLADKDRYIGELSSEKETLAQRLSQVSHKDESVTPNVSSGSPFDTNQIAEFIERQTYINKVKDSNQDLIELGLEPQITQDADRYIRQGKTFKDAVDRAVRDRREVVEKKFKTTKEVPSGARSETPANTTPIAPPPVKEKDIEDEGDARHVRRMRLGL